MPVEFKCSDIGADTCKKHFVAQTWEELMGQVADHLRIVHRVKTPTQTLMTYIAKKVKVTSA
jgi:predicted small metal-binding protein